MKTPQETAQEADARAKAVTGAAMAAAARKLLGPGTTPDEESAADALAQVVEPAQEPPSDD